MEAVRARALVLILVAACLAHAEDDPLPAGALARLGSTRLRHQDEVVSLAFSPDSKVLASTGHDGTLRLWEVPSGRAIARFPTRGDETVAWVGTARLGLVSERAVRFLDLEGKETAGWHAQDERTCAVALSPSGKLVAHGTKAGELHVCDASTGVEQWWVHAHDDHVLAIAFSPDEKLVATTSRDDKLRIWRGKDPVASHAVQLGTWVGFSPDGEALAVVAVDRLTVLRSVDASVEYESDAERLHACAFGPGSRALALVSHDRHVVLLDLEHRTRRALEHRVEATAAAFAPDGETVATGDRAGTIDLWSAAEGRAFDLPRHASRVARVAVSPNEKTIVTLADDGALHLWRDGEHEELPVEGYPSAVEFAPDGALVVGCVRGPVRTMDLATRTVLRRIDVGGGSFDAVALATSGSRVVAGSRSGVLTIQDGSVSHAYSFEAAVTCVTFAGDRVLVATADRKVRVIARTGEVSVGHLPEGSFRVVSTLSVSGDGALVAILWADGTLRVCALPGFEEKRALPERCSAAAFAPSGRRLAMGMSDGSIKIVNTDTGAEERVLRGHAGGVTCLAWSPDGARLVSGSRDGTALVWKTGER
ncbi:MAG TPA: WD40 repeat domain-containing protein [Planctomycetota bacterium]|nr:WD40 repeat domain-containing protein [Planctomycetota bacterium]